MITLLPKVSENDGQRRHSTKKSHTIRTADFTHADATNFMTKDIEVARVPLMRFGLVHKNNQVVQRTANGLIRYVKAITTFEDELQVPLCKIFEFVQEKEVCRHSDTKVRRRMLSALAEWGKKSLAHAGWTLGAFQLDM